ncbi:MAG: hypothetical protein O9330_04270 [Beijerinckiaceae bacterium]|nr:hypothetical protein [Beijerinckiaceae bacterium]
MASPKRDHAYFLQLLKKREPAVFARFEAGEFASVAAALIAGGIRAAPKPINVLERAWKNASAADRDAFLVARGLGPLAPAPVRSASGLYVDPDRRFTALGKLRLTQIMKTRSIKMGVVVTEIGQKVDHPSVGNARSQGTRMQPHVAEAISEWIQRHESLAP